MVITPKTTAFLLGRGELLLFLLARGRVGSRQFGEVAVADELLKELSLDNSTDDLDVVQIPVLEIRENELAIFVERVPIVHKPLLRAKRFISRSPCRSRLSGGRSSADRRSRCGVFESCRTPSFTSDSWPALSTP